ncbi:hypothetical protein DSECCO2_48790 [anaerobic digester metagenome]
MDQKILNNLKKFEKLTDSTLCLECGYKGPMGIKSYREVDTKTKRFITGLLIFSTVCLFIFHGILNIIGFIFSLVLFLMMKIVAPKPDVLFCPNCEKELFVKN